ncbi:hypothetical protein CLI64_08000 [Nostoc sp. CENA543]|uniref:hypothetical protein n=1 Tax=Nostoc sp. CENA543 TaxID=1869241 RepID=UPI000CA1CBA2|nr:hypothetical protein [Nostoc sp. CENA543]AUT00333.1 hypothetical protein CLI64_08000 [Nostoc sp. CENA543]
MFINPLQVAFATYQPPDDQKPPKDSSDALKLKPLINQNIDKFPLHRQTPKPVVNLLNNHATIEDRALNSAK